MVSPAPEQPLDTHTGLGHGEATYEIFPWKLSFATRCSCATGDLLLQQHSETPTRESAMWVSYQRRSVDVLLVVVSLIHYCNKTQQLRK